MIKNGKFIAAYKWFYENAKGPVPEGLELDHLCGVPGCVNPDHLEAVTGKENVQRYWRAKRQRETLQASQLV